MTIKPLLFNALETAINRYLALANNLDVVLPPLAGKTVAITLQPFNETVYFCFSHAGIQLLDQLTEPANTHLTGSVWAFGLMGLSTKPMRSIFSGQVSLTGDIHTGQKFQDLFSKLDINLQQQLARFTGETMAQNVSQFFHKQLDWHKTTLETLRLNTTEFLQEETRDLPPAAELEIYYRQIDNLRIDFDRLHSRMTRLESVLRKPTTH